MDKIILEMTQGKELTLFQTFFILIKYDKRSNLFEKTIFVFD